MKKNVIFLLIGMALVIIGAFLKITDKAFSSYVIIAGLAIEAYTLCALVLHSLKKLK